MKIIDKEVSHNLGVQMSFTERTPFSAVAKGSSPALGDDYITGQCAPSFHGTPVLVLQ